jgi:hypothetical protein
MRSYSTSLQLNYRPRKIFIHFPTWVACLFSIISKQVKRMERGNVDESSTTVTNLILVAFVPDFCYFFYNATVLPVILDPR